MEGIELLVSVVQTRNSRHISSQEDGVYVADPLGINEGTVYLKSGYMVTVIKPDKGITIIDGYALPAGHLVYPAKSLEVVALM
ncbi:hypothetical protein [Pseudomonas phage PPAY]|nr:hypothetical protein [Pseudomonas phage PPAY]UCW44428.1 hypothetical protein [Pseudomonas phage PPAT]